MKKQKKCQPSVVGPASESGSFTRMAKLASDKGKGRKNLCFQETR